MCFHNMPKRPYDFLRTMVVLFCVSQRPALDRTYVNRKPSTEVQPQNPRMRVLSACVFFVFAVL